MEGKDNQTTIGGVTFGGNAPAPAPEPVSTASTLTPIGGETAGAVAAGAAENVAGVAGAVPAGTAGAVPVEAAQPEQPEPTKTTLNVPFVSPTSFDEKNTVRPVVKDPSLPNIPQPVPVPAPAPQPVASTSATAKDLKKFTTLAIVFGALMIVFLIVGVIGLVLNMSTADKLSRTEAELAHSNQIVKAVEETTGVVINDYTDVPVYKATTGYIYISEWNIKIKIPDNLDYVSYILNQNYRPSICFNAVQKGTQYFPDFANVQLNPGKMGCLTRIAVSEGSFDAATGLSFGTLVFTNKDYNYFYTGSTDYSNPETDAANLGLEHTSVQIIKNMLTDNVEVYE